MLGFTLGRFERLVDPSLRLEPLQVIVLRVLFDLAEQFHRFGLEATLARIVEWNDQFDLYRDHIPVGLNEPRPLGTFAQDPDDRPQSR